MARGFKTGGRTQGTPNRSTLEVADRLKELGCDPIAGMATIATDPSASLELRGRMYSELAQYVYPKRKALAVEAVVQHDSLSLMSADEIRATLADIEAIMNSIGIKDVANSVALGACEKRGVAA